MKRLHKNKIDNAKFYEKIWGEEYNLRPYYDAVRMRALARDIKDGDKVIDIGAGVFGTCQYIAEHTDLKCELYAYDQSYTAKQIINKIAPQINYIIGDCSEKLPFKDKEFDVVTAGEIIEHMEDPAEFAKELCRIGKNIALSTVNPDCDNAKGRDYPEHLWKFTPEDLIGFFSPYGETEYTTVGDYHFIYCRCR